MQAATDALPAAELLDARAVGADAGALATLHVYARAAQTHTLVVMAALDALKRLFGWQADEPPPMAGMLSATHRQALWAPVIVARNAGLALVNASPAAKRALASVAMGDGGDE